MTSLMNQPLGNPRPLVHTAFTCHELTIGVGVAIFHLATRRVVVCGPVKDNQWFLPNGRKRANEETGFAAEREGCYVVKLASRSFISGSRTR